MIRLTDFLLISPAFLSALVSPCAVFLPFFFLPPPIFFTDISCLKAENWSELARSRARLIVHSYRGKLILHHRRIFLRSFGSLLFCILLVPVDSRAIKGGN